MKPDEAVELLRECCEFIEPLLPDESISSMQYPHKLVKRCRALFAQPKAAPQPSTTTTAAASSQEGVGRGDVASAAPEGMPSIRTLEDARAEMEGCDDSEWANYLEGLVRQHERALSLRGREGMVMVPRDTLKHWAEYWNGNRNDSAMFDALEHIINEIDNMLAAAPSPGREGDIDMPFSGSIERKT